MNTHFRHTVEIYRDEEIFLGTLADYMSEGLLGNESCIVVATKDHRTALFKSLEQKGLDVVHFETTGQYVALDAATTLSHFMVNDMPSADDFKQVVGSLLPVIPTRKIRAYGEMVALLWEEGNVAAALKLETLWNDLGKVRNFKLHCAYPHRITEKSAPVSVREIFNLHAHN